MVEKKHQKDHINVRLATFAYGTLTHSDINYHCKALMLLAAKAEVMQLNYWNAFSFKEFLRIANNRCFVAQMENLAIALAQVTKSCGCEIWGVMSVGARWDVFLHSEGSHHQGANFPLPALPLEI